MRPRYFESAAAFRAWLDAHHDTASEIFVGVYRKSANRGTITYQQALDEALCHGWIDGIRRNVDEQRYTIRFTPRRPGSRWSAVNVRRVGELIAAGRMKLPGTRAFAARGADEAGYSYEHRARGLDPAYEKALRANARAWTHFQSRPPWYRRTAGWWVMSAKKEETRQRRLATLVAHCERGLTLPQFIPRPTDRK